MYVCPFQTIADLELSVAHLEDKQERDFEKQKKVREDNQVMMNNDFELFQESNTPFQFLNNNDCMSFISHHFSPPVK